MPMMIGQVGNRVVGRDENGRSVTGTVWQRRDASDARLCLLFLSVVQPSLPVIDQFGANFFSLPSNFRRISHCVVVRSGNQS